ncbi:hypothetical protein [Flavobacterium sp.]|jgi:hypothetical protein|uniref:hypothetical protein n=1 Tax=Flavobacterium sp. TaxID=239 RepID=UPI003784CDFB
MKLSVLSILSFLLFPSGFEATDANLENAIVGKWICHEIQLKAMKNISDTLEVKYRENLKQIQTTNRKLKKAPVK